VGLIGDPKNQTREESRISTAGARKEKKTPRLGFPGLHLGLSSPHADEEKRYNAG